jgi:hypothetical protein
MSISLGRHPVDVGRALIRKRRKFRRLSSVAVGLGLLGLLLLAVPLERFG